MRQRTIGATSANVTIRQWNQAGKRYEFSGQKESAGMDPSSTIKGGSGITAAPSSGGTAAPEPEPINLIRIGFTERKVTQQLIFDSFRKVASLRDLESEFSNLIAEFRGKETEENWESREQAFQRLRGLVRGNAAGMDGFVPLLKGMVDPLVKSIASLRTALVMTACSTVADLSTFLTTKLEPLVDPLLVNLLKLTSQTKKIVVNACIAAITTLLRNSTSPSSSSQQQTTTRNLGYFYSSLSESKNGSARCSAAGFVKVVFEEMLKGGSAGGSGIDLVEKCMKKGLSDALPAVRETSREMFAMYQTAWPEKAESFLDSLEPSTKKAILRQQKASESKSSGLRRPGSFRSNLSLVKKQAQAAAQSQTPSRTATVSEVSTFGSGGGGMKRSPPGATSVSNQVNKTPFAQRGNEQENEQQQVDKSDNRVNAGIQSAPSAPANTAMAAIAADDALFGGMLLQGGAHGAAGSVRDGLAAGDMGAMTGLGFEEDAGTNSDFLGMDSENNVMDETLPYGFADISSHHASFAGGVSVGGNIRPFEGAADSRAAPTQEYGTQPGYVQQHHRDADVNMTDVLDEMYNEGESTLQDETLGDNVRYRDDGRDRQRRDNSERGYHGRVFGAVRGGDAGGGGGGVVAPNGTDADIGSAEWRRNMLNGVEALTVRSADPPSGVMRALEALTQSGRSRDLLDNQALTKLQPSPQKECPRLLSDLLRTFSEQMAKSITAATTTTTNRPSSSSSSSSGIHGVNNQLLRKLIRISLSSKVRGCAALKREGGNGIPSERKKRERDDDGEREGDVGNGWQEEMWDDWFDEMLDLVLGFLGLVGPMKAEQETALILLSELIRNQTPYFVGYETRVAKCVFDCRSDGSPEVSGIADRVVQILLQVFDTVPFIASILDLFSDPEFVEDTPLNGQHRVPIDTGNVIAPAAESDSSNATNRSSSNGRLQPSSVMNSQSSFGGTGNMAGSTMAAQQLCYTRRAMYQPPPARSALEVLGALVKKVGKRGCEEAMVTEAAAAKLGRSRDAAGNTETWFGGVVDVALKSLSSPSTEIRKGAILFLADFCQVMGEGSFFMTFNGRLTDSQEKLVFVFVERRRKQMGSNRDVDASMDDSEDGGAHTGGGPSVDEEVVASSNRVKQGLVATGVQQEMVAGRWIWSEGC
ncbi:suppressor of tub2 mutation [Quaeritorhiza haematococci]|nr:suppressor of tub2 mutation [Quaeritorhiza haematococci]